MCGLIGHHCEKWFKLTQLWVSGAKLSIIARSCAIPYIIVLVQSVCANLIQMAEIYIRMGLWCTTLEFGIKERTCWTGTPTSELSTKLRTWRIVGHNNYNKYKLMHV